MNGQVNKITFYLEFENNGNYEDYKIKAFCDKKIYAKELDSCYLLGFYYLSLWKGYPKEKNI